MNAKKKRTLVVFGLAALLFVTGSIAAWANDTTYDPTTKTIEMSKPFTQSFNITVTAPTSLNAQGTAALPVTADIQVTVADKPPTATNAEALSLVSVLPTALGFSAAGEAQSLGVTVDVTSGATVGSYTYNILAQKEGNVPSWGNGTPVVLTVVVDEPTPTDTTPPSVTITSPTVDQSLTFCTGGTPVDIAFNAQDGESAISTVDADVNGNPVLLSTVTGIGTGNVDASGTYNVNSIGGYTLTARATSLGGTGDATQNFSVSFNVMWLPPLSLGKTSKGGSTVPIKFTARDCNGDFVHDESVTVVVLDVDDANNPTRLNGVFGEGASSVRIDDEVGQYIINFQTAAGVHNYRVDVYFNDFNNTPYKQGSKTFSVR